MNSFLKYMFLVSFIFTQQVATIKGIVHDKSSNELIYGANVYLKGTTKGAVTDRRGNFLMKGLKPSKYVLIVEFIGYKTKRVEVVLEAGETKTINVGIEYGSIAGECVVITAGREKQFQRDVPVMINVVNEFAFNSTQSINLAEGLNFVPAVRIENNCQNCGFTQVRLNGMEGSYAQILIDGRPVFSALNGVYGLEQIPKSMIKQIEVIRGGGSSMYGSNAIAGVINVITTEPLTNGYEFSANQSFIEGSASDRNFAFSSSLVDDERTKGLSLFSHFRDRDHYDANTDGFSEITELSGQSYGVQAYYKPSNTSKFSIDFHHMYEKRRGGNNFHLKPHEADIAEALTHNVNGGNLTYEHFFSSDNPQKITLYSSAQHTDRDSYYGAGKDPNAYGNTTEWVNVFGGEYSLRLNNHAILFGIEHNLNFLKDSQLKYNREIEQHTKLLGTFIQDDWTISPLFSITAGLRLDHHSKIESPIVSPRLNVLTHLTEHLQLRTSFATGFRAPQTYDEDLHIESVGSQKFHLVKESDGLTPEHSENVSVSLDYSDDDSKLPWGFTVEGFYTRLTDVFVNEYSHQDQNFVYYNKINAEGATVVGGTLEYRTFFTQQLEFQAGLTFQNSMYDSVLQLDTEGKLRSKTFLRTPGLYGFYLSKWMPNPHFSINLSGVYTGKMKLYHTAGYIETDRIEYSKPFIETNIKLNYELDELGKGFPVMNLSGGVQNIFNAYQSDFDKGENRDSAFIYGPNRPRTFFLGLEFNY